MKPEDLHALVNLLRGEGWDSARAQRTLAQMFRSRTVTVDGELCRLLADAVDPGGKGPVQLSLKRRKRGRPQKINDYDIAVYVREKRKSGWDYTPAVEEAMDEFKLSHGTVTAAVKKFKRKP